MLNADALTGVLVVVFLIHMMVMRTLFARLIKGRASTNDYLRESRENLGRMREETRVTMSAPRDQLAAMEQRRKQMDERFAVQTKRSEEMLAVQREQLAVLKRMESAMQRNV